MKYLWLLTLLIPFLLLVSSCQKDVSFEEQIEIDKEIILDHLAKEGIQADSTAEGIYYVLHAAGTGDVHPTINSKVKVRYKGYFLNGTVFDETEGTNTIEFFLSQVIEGWQIGIPLMKKSGSITLYIPSRYAYGTSGVGSIPGNSVLAFDVDLVSFN